MWRCNRHVLIGRGGAIYSMVAVDQMLTIGLISQAGIRGVMPGPDFCPYLGPGLAISHYSYSPTLVVNAQECTSMVTC